MDSASYGVLDVSDNATVTIEDDDFATLTIASGADVTLDEGDNSRRCTAKFGVTALEKQFHGGGVDSADRQCHSRSRPHGSFQSSHLPVSLCRRQKTDKHLRSTEDSIAEDK